jgi:1-acyl-sn-glycerol-3-phosphate acyltransferase
MHDQQSAPRKAGPLRVALVGLATVLITLGYSVRVLALGAIGRLRRAKVDGFTRDWSGSLLRLTGARLSRHGEVPDFGDGRRYMILCTHSSFYDIPAIFVTLPGSIRMLAKRELFAVPVWGAAMRAAEFPSIDRHNRHQAMADLTRARGDDGEWHRALGGARGYALQGRQIAAIQEGLLPPGPADRCDHRPGGHPRHPATVAGRWPEVEHRHAG